MYNSLSYKSKQFFWLIIKLSIVIGCGYFIQQRLTSNNKLQFSAFYQNLIKNDIFSIKNSIFLFIFTFLNWFLEITKWEILASFCVKTSKKNATIQSLASLTTSLITPNRIGEYGAKALYFNKSLRKQVVGLNIIGNFYQMIITLFLGVIGFLYFVYKHNISIDYSKISRFVWIVFLVILVLIFGINYFKSKNNFVEKVKTFIDRIPLKLNLKVGFISLLRFLVFSHQFYFVLLLFKVDISYLDAISAITTVYFISSMVPMLSLFDFVLKGTVAIWVFSFFTIEPFVILSATTIMWVFNFVLPAIIGSYFVLTFKPNFVK
ncbi:hypothetical protein [Polaribacter cellanae]|uniref:Uncharacterized protein n=1 Tax=Polaribacter cellanae TaxID=2818493 RepID=A0A975CQI9_9FLAO|nr:hypothetical protein [Polaribacter cellanae]QTE22047.1 hypothetical protein J3359_14700 [Polaribacter cellanae]